MIDAETAGQRLDNFLLTRLKGVPRSHVYRLIRSGQVRVNSGRAAAHYRLRSGDKVRIPPVRRPGAVPAPATPGGLDWLEQRIVFEDERLLVLDKPAGMAVHGGSGVGLGCIEALRSLRPDAKTLELVHRLDRATSGCLLVAKKRSTLRALHALLRGGAIEKRYLALLKGDWQHGRHRVDAPLERIEGSHAERVRVAESGKAATSEFRLIESFGIASLVEVSIDTGRTHQIRVHAAHIGHPVAGDERYGDAALNAALARYGLRRMFLHAHVVAFQWPDTDAEFEISVPLPEDLKDVLEALNENSSAPKDRGPRRAKSRRPRSRAGP